jgi:butyrate kinase
MEKTYILTINPGSTSTKISLFSEDKMVFLKNLSYSNETIKSFQTIFCQKEMRLKGILESLQENNINLKDLAAVVGRGGLLRPMPGGTYQVSGKMIEDLKIGYQGEHASNLGGILASEIGKLAGVNAYIVDPVSVDEYEEVARISGISEIKRRSLVHALNIKAVVRKVSKEISKDYLETSFVAAHLGGGTSIAAVKNGRIVDSNSANDEGPFSPDRTGGLPAMQLINIACSGKYTYKDLKKKIVGEGGLIGYLGTNDGKEVIRRIEEDNEERAKLIFDAMAYQIGKDIASMATVLKGKMDGIILTGGLAYSEYLMDKVKDYIGFITRIYIVPGEDEMYSLYQGAKRVLDGAEQAKIYEKEVNLND